MSVLPNNAIIAAMHIIGEANEGVYLSDVNQTNFEKKITYSATYGSSISTYEGIQVDGSYIVLNEYDSGPYGERTGAKVWMSKDYGETFKVVFDGHKYPKVANIPGAAGYNHIHGAFYDKYWDRLWIAGGDRELSGLLWSDKYWNRSADNDTFSDYQFRRYNPKDGDTINYAKGIPQPIAGFAMPNAVFFGTDAYPNGIFATKRVSRDNPIFERVSSIGEDKDTITCIPSMYLQSDYSNRFFVKSGIGDESTEKYDSILTTVDGVNWSVIWRDNIERTATGVSALTEPYCWEGETYTWIRTSGYNDAGKQKVLKCRNLK